MTYEFRAKLAGPTAGTAANSLSALNAPGPSNFTGQSLASTAKFDTDPAGGSTTVLHIPISTAAAQRIDNTLTTSTQARQVSASIMVYLSALPPSGSANNLQVLNVQATDGTTAYTGIAASVSSTGAVGLALGADSKTYAFPASGITITAGKWYRINVWADMGTTASNGIAGCAAYDTAAGTQVGSTYSNTAANLGGATAGSIYTTVWTGKADKANQGIDLYVQSHVESLGVAHDVGASPSMSVPTPPTMSFVPHMDLDPGRRVQIYARVTPTTSGATETGITCTTGTPVDLSGNTVADAPTITWGAPSTSNETNRTREATTPYYRKTLVYPVTVTGTDSTGLTASQTIQLRVFGHDLWLNGKAAIFVPPKAS